MLHPESRRKLLGSQLKGWELPLQVKDAVAAPAHQMSMTVGPAVVARHLVQGVDLDDQPLLAKYLQGLVNSVEGDGGRAASTAKRWGVTEIPLLRSF